MAKRILLVVSVIVWGTGTFGLELSVPVRWHLSGYLLRYIPRTERYFTEGAVDCRVDMLQVRFNRISTGIFLRSAIWAGMGYQSEDVIFDPRDAHYSLSPGLWGDFDNYYLVFQWLHDCFHEVDRKTEPTIIWNAFEFRFSPASFLTHRRIEDVNYAHLDRVKLFSGINWQVYFAFYPKLKSVNWFQYKHPFSSHIRGIFDINLAEFKRFKLNFEYNPTFWRAYGGKIYHREFARFKLDYVGEDGIFSFFYGYTFYEDQPVRPKPHQAVIGFEWQG